MMGADCKNQVNYRTFNRWSKDMDYNNLKCPDGDINDLCDSGYFKYDPFPPGYPGKCIAYKFNIFNNVYCNEDCNKLLKLSSLGFASKSTTSPGERSSLNVGYPFTLKASESGLPSALSQSTLLNRTV